MAWPYSGSWEGQPIPNLSYIIASICVAINERNREMSLSRGLSETFRDIDFTTTTGTEVMPTASDFVGYRVDNNDVINEIIGGIFSLNTDSLFNWYTTSDFDVQIPLDDDDDWQAILDDAGIDWTVNSSGYLNPPSHIGQAQFWLAAKCLLDKLVYCEKTLNNHGALLSPTLRAAIEFTPPTYPDNFVSVSDSAFRAGVRGVGGSAMSAVPECSYPFSMPDTMQSTTTYRYFGSIDQTVDTMAGSSSAEFSVFGDTITVDASTDYPLQIDGIDGSNAETIVCECTDYSSIEVDLIPGGFVDIKGGVEFSCGANILMDMTTFLADQA
jgi:hypothetical protein